MNDMQVLVMEWQNTETLVGASLLAKIANHGAHLLDKRVTLWFFASKLAPTQRALQCFDVSAEEKAPHPPQKKCPASIDTGHFHCCLKARS
ncbi:hypothetical protein [Pseudomonas sp. NFX224]|uniref:hypothetical protein n=1 Tax=Pseudomonas sp. NFX224 TaxID=3402862 RepID=UPI003AFA5092